MSSAFDKYCSFFHQDIFVIHDTLEAAIEDNISALMPETKKELQVYLEDTLRLKDNLTNMDVGDIYFSNVHGFQYFLEQSLLTVQSQTE
jgi:hypothetical protein